MNTEITEDLLEKKSVAAATKEYIIMVTDKIESLVRDENFKASDIMILVQRRGRFGDWILSELKKRNIEVAGSDKVVLPDFPAIRDLLNLLRFCINNADEYSLCCTLKSPIYRLKEADIFKLCTARKSMQKQQNKTDLGVKKTTVFDVLQEYYPEIFKELSQMIKDSKEMAPYSFFTKILNTNGRREKIISALGTQVIDPIEEFLTICLSYERTQPGTLRHFIKWFVIGSSEIKRDMDASDGVRIVTIHGSKGLESKVVFLIDTIRTPSDKPERILPIAQEPIAADVKNFPIWLWAPKTNASEKLNIIENDSAQRQISEYYRLLYVAMTRARDRLYIYGFSTYKTINEKSWYSQLINILSQMPGAKNDGKKIVISNV